MTRLFVGVDVSKDWLDAAVRKEGLDDEEQASALRAHGFHGIEQVKLAVLEADGTISVVGYGGGRGSRRPRPGVAASSPSA